MESNEIWKDVVGYEGLYMVSNKGKVKSMPRKAERITYGYGRIEPTSRVYSKEEYFLSIGVNSGGYSFVRLIKDRVGKNFTVHRLVAIAFIPNPYNKPYVNHKDGDKTNACVENLEWCTPSENEAHAYNIGIKKPAKAVIDGNTLIDKDTGRHVNCRRVIQKDLSGKPIAIWDSIKDAAYGTGIIKPRIAKACRINISAGDFLWEYEGKSISEKRSEKPAKRIVQKDMSGNVVNVWDNVHQIKKENNFRMKLILDVCRGGMRTAYDFFWEFEKKLKDEKTQETTGFSIITE